MTPSKSTSKKIYILLSASILAINSISGFSISMASECTQKNSNGHCVKVQRDNQPKKDTHSKKSPSHDQSNGTDIPSEGSSSGASVEAARKSWEDNHIPMRDGTNQTVYGTVPEARKAGDAECYTKVDRRPGHYTIGPLPQGDNANRIPNHVGGRYCVPNDAKTFTSNDPAQPKGPSPEEMLQEVEDQFANTNIQAPVLKQSYNLGTGLSEDNPNVHKGDQINFYVDAPTARWEGDLMIGHVEMESYPTQMTIQYGNGDEGSFYTMGKPVSRARGEESRKTSTSYAYQRSGNFHAYATVSYSGRFRVDGGDWQALDVVLTKETVDPLLIRVWWTDVGRVAGDCSYDDTRWGCKNDPTMGKPDNPNPRLRKADIRTGQRWHLNPIY